ncbi:MAG TPA: RNA polymerase sigma factor [Acidimicrobiia bacterium]|jgi:RNA polymerase sigma-70 factor (ECF subfamily)
MREGLMAKEDEEGGGAAPGGDVAPIRPALRAVAPAGDRYADWREVYDDNVVRIHRLMYAKVGNRPDAEDLTAEVFLAALGPLRLSVSRGEVRAYLLRTAQTVLASFWRRRLGCEVTTIDLTAAPPLEAGGPAPAPDDDGGGRSARRARRILDALPDRYRRVLELRFVEGRSVRDSAQAMGVTVANAKVLQHRALRLAASLPEEAS